MNRWLDVQSDDWFFNEVMEATSIEMGDGRFFIGGIPYSVFQPGKPYHYEEFLNVSGTRYEFQLARVLIVDSENPLFVFVDGVRTLYKAIRVWSQNPNRSEVELFHPPASGSTVSFMSLGVPDLDATGRPKMAGGEIHPNTTLSRAGSYVYLPHSVSNQEHLNAFGQVLRRAQVSDNDWLSMAGQAVAQKYIHTRQDVYCVSPSGVVYVPYMYNNMTLSMTYAFTDGGLVRSRTEAVRPTSPLVLHTNRFVPSASIFWSEAVVFIDRLRTLMYRRFSDTEAPQVTIPGGVTVFWWTQALYNVNSLRLLPDDVAIVELVQVTDNPSAFIRRREVVRMLNRFRKWCLQTFKV